ncbi:hypothetical protein GETHLI_12410 [Geothrix limicola]|uniref:Lipase n=1 Tax=Geothrix limicola TaxID=2927978 RepID=A0ABQ5QDS2_9BACT|nr:hypothetical protein [Geothrix limicola]GLH72739.1 hypothetical protein GETHLI_12410 [Geothrix limicola]
MHRRLTQAAFGTVLLTLFACNGGGDSKAPTLVTGTSSIPSATAAVFDPANAKIPLPNILATAAAVDPISKAWINPLTGATVTGARPYGVPMQPPEALAYVAYHEVGGPNYGYPDTTFSTHAVSGLNAPIYFAFSGAVDATTVTPSTVKVFQVLPDSNGLTENATLGFQDVSGLFTYTASAACPNAGAQASGQEFLLFPKVPLTPGARFLYVVTDGVKDKGTPAKSIVASPYFEALKSTTALTGSFAALEPIRADNMSGTNVLLSGYAKVMSDLIANAAADTTAKTGATATGIATRANITLMGRFITTGAGGIRTLASDSTTIKPMDAILRGFAAGSFGAAKAWNNTVTISAALPAATYFGALGLPASTYTNISTVVLGSYHSADLQMDPAVAATATSAGVDLTTLAGGSGTAQGATNPYSYSTGITQPVRAAATGGGLTAGQLLGFYNTDRQIPFVYFIPVGGAATYKTVILQHGITSQKEAAAAAANTIAMSGKATIAIDLPMHGALAQPANQVLAGDTAAVKAQKQANWGSDFMSLTSLLTGRTNVQQAALNLHRLEILMRTGTPFGTAFATYAGGAITGYPTPGATGNITFVGQSLGSICGAYYLAGNATLATSGAPYTQATLNNDMKGFLSVPGSTLAYLLKDSPSFSPTVNAGLSAASGGTVVPGTTAYTQFFLVAQTLVDPVDPASMTLPLTTGLPSRLSGRTAMQEAVGDTVIPNYTTRYLGQALGGRTLFGYDFAPGFNQLVYKGDTAPKVPFMAGATPTTLKALAAAYSPAATSPTEGYFQFNQTGIDHGFLLDNTTPANTGAAQKQLLFFLGGPAVGGSGLNIVVDPYSF